MIQRASVIDLLWRAWHAETRRANFWQRRAIKYREVVRELVESGIRKQKQKPFEN